MAIVEKRGESYSIRVSSGYSTDGKQVRRNFTWSPAPGMTDNQIKKELARQVVLLEERAASGNLIDEKIKFEEFASRWMKEYAEKQLAPKTVHSYRDLLVRINAAIGHIRLDHLSPVHLMEFYNNLAEDGIRADKRYIADPELKKKIKAKSKSRHQFSFLAGIHENTVLSACRGNKVSAETALGISVALGNKLSDNFKPSNDNHKLSGTTIRYYHRVISCILQTALKWQVIESNPASRVSAPKAEKHESKFLDEDQAKRVIELLDKEPIQQRTMITLFIYSGFRRGELCGLQWPDIDFKNNLIHVRRAMQYIPGQGLFVKETKTAGSTRTIKLSSIAFALLKEFKRWQDEERLRLGDAWQLELREKAREEKRKYFRTEWLFTTWDGMPVNPDYVTLWFSNFVKRNSLPPVSIHSLRHTNATLMIAGGANIRTVSSRLGHTLTSTTSNIYAHAIQSADAAAADTLENLLNPNKPQINHNLA